MYFLKRAIPLVIACLLSVASLLLVTEKVMYPVQGHTAPAVVQQGQTVVTQPVYPAAPVVVNTTPSQSRMNVKAIRGLGITQIVIGSLTVVLGIGAIAGFSSGYWLTRTGGGIWGGLWILVTGIIGVLSAGRPVNGCLNGTHMGFCILASIVAFLDGIFFAIGIGFYSTCKSEYRYYYSFSYNYHLAYFDDRCYDHRTAGSIVYSILLLLMIAEFFVAIVASAFCCMATSCCSSSTPGVIFMQQPGHHVVQHQAYPNQQMGVPGYGYPEQPFQQTPITAPAAMTHYPNTGYTYQDQGDVVKLPPPPSYE